MHAGLRRVHTDRADGRRRATAGAQGGAGHGGEQVPAAGGVRHGGDGQGRRGEQVPRHRLLRRRPRPRRPGLRPIGGPSYAVKKGRKDSKVSLPGKVRGSLPRANSTVDELLRVFAAKGLGAGDLVALSGAHTIGFAHCIHVLGRIYDFRGTRRPDPLMDARLVKALRMSCPSTGGSARVVVPFDVSTPFQFDHAYYANLQARLGLLASDQALFLDPRTRPLVQELAADKAHFFQAFVASMDRMGSIRIKKGKKGEVRKVCSQHLL
uniref:Plant heme peroxidase family profile domain-containing protein n=1 Tax=Arundo donax TaxID=35708 RepID=A0A0A8YBM2_ARUDO